MKKLVQDFSLTKVENSSKYYLELGHHQFYVGELVAFVLTMMKVDKSITEIIEGINEKFCTDSTISEADFDQIIEEHITPLGVFDEPSKNRSQKSFDEVKWKKVLFSSDMTSKLASPFRFLYQPLFFFVTFIALIIGNVFFAKELPKVMLEFDFGIYSIIGFPLVYSCLFLIIIFHELGHAAASLKFNTKPNSIGAGFYFFFPVLYTDVTQIWKLSKTKKVIVNMAGVYNQLLVNMVLFLILTYTPSETVAVFVSAIALANLSVAAVNLFPFLKYDAYWMFSDITDIRNLAEKSRLYVYSLIGIKRSGEDYGSYSVPLKIYSLIKFVLFSFLYTYILYRGAKEMIHIEELGYILRYFSFSLITILYVFRVMMIFLLSGYVLISLSKLIVRIFNKLTKGVAYS